MSFQTFSSRALLGAALISLLGLAACGSGSSSGFTGNGGGGGGGGGTPPPITNTDCNSPTSHDDGGCAFVSLTDAAGDFLTYTVGVTKITLTRRDGAVVTVLPKAATVDFAQYTDLSEFLTLNAIPVGDYQSGVVTLDYTHADIEDQDSNGNAVKLSPIDGNGQAITTLDVTIDFDASHPFGVVAGVPHLLGIDFDLDASNVVNNTQKTVTVQPFLVASVDDVGGKEQLVRGPLISVNASGFSIGLRPFRAGTDDFGKVPVFITSTTTFIVNQKVYTGSGGLAALQAAGATTAVLVQGSFDFSNHRFVADEVKAGSSVPGGNLDAAEGVVTARSGNTLTLRGATLYRAGQTVSFADDVTVDVGSGTVVREIDHLKSARNAGDISVGQHLLVLGSLGSGGSTHLDATGGFALLEFTRVDGTVSVINTSGTNASITMDVQAIEGHAVGEFDFSGTGSDRTNYDVDLPCSCLSDGVTIGDPVRITGFVTPFGSAPADFEAQTLVDYENADALISTAWSGGGTASAFTSIDAKTGIVPNLASAPLIHKLRQGGVVSDLNSLSNAPTIKAKPIGVYAVLRDGQVKIYFGFASFVSAVQSDLSAGAKVKGFFAKGGFMNNTDVMTADSIAIVLH